METKVLFVIYPQQYHPEKYIFKNGKATFFNLLWHIILYTKTANNI